jgi:hypothetical protein
MPLRFPLPAPNRRRRSLFFLIGFLPQKTIRLQTPSTSLFLLSHWVPTRNRQSGSKHRRRRSLFFLIGYFPQQTIRLQTPSTSLSLSSFSLDSIHQRQRFSTTVHVAISLLSLGVQSRPDNPVHEHRRRLYLFLLSRFNLDSFQLRQSGQPTPSTSLFSFFHMRHSHALHTFYVDTVHTSLIALVPFTSHPMPVPHRRHRRRSYRSRCSCTHVIPHTYFLLTTSPSQAHKVPLPVGKTILNIS